MLLFINSFLASGDICHLQISFFENFFNLKLEKVGINVPTKVGINVPSHICFNNRRYLYGL